MMAEDSHTSSVEFFCCKAFVYHAVRRSRKTKWSHNPYVDFYKWVKGFFFFPRLFLESELQTRSEGMTEAELRLRHENCISSKG